MKLFVGPGGHTPLERNTFGDTAKPVLERTGSASRLRALATRDRDGGDVLARIERAVAIAIPFDVFQIERDRGRQRRALDSDPGSDFFTASRIDGNAAVACKGYATRPCVWRRLLPDGREHSCDVSLSQGCGR